MEKNKYIPIMIQSLKKKEQVLDSIIQLNRKQKEELENPTGDPDDFEKVMSEKAECIEQLELLDEGFEEIFEKVRDELNVRRDLYRDEIAQMQTFIQGLTAKSATIQTEEARNKELMQKKFASIRKQVKEVRQSQKVVNQYYKNMMKTNFVESQFTDNKK